MICTFNRFGLETEFQSLFCWKVCLNKKNTCLFVRHFIVSILVLLEGVPKYTKSLDGETGIEMFQSLFCWKVCLNIGGFAGWVQASFVSILVLLEGVPKSEVGTGLPFVF